MSQGPLPASEPRRGSVVTVLLVIFVDLLGFGIVIPLLAYVTASYGELPEWAVNLFDWLGMGEGLDRRNAVAIGILALAFSLTQFLFAPLWGRLSDFIGRKPVLAISMAGYTLSWLMFLVSPDLTWLILSRTLAGIFAANIAAAQAYIADIYPPEKRSKGMGLVGAAFGLGFTLGPAIGAGLALLGNTIQPPVSEIAGVEYSPLALQIPIAFAMGLSFLAFLLAAFRLPESLTPELREIARQRQRVGRLRLLADALGKPVIGPLLIGFFTVTFGFAVLEQLYSEFNRGVLGLKPSANSIAFAVVGLTIVVMQGGLIGRLTKRYGPWKLVIAGLLLEGVTLCLFGLVPSMGMLLIASVGLAAGNSLCNPSILSLISQNTPSDQQGGAMGLSAASSAFGRLLGPILGAMVYGKFGPVAAFASGGVVVLLALPLVVMAWLRKRREAALLA